MLVFLSAQSGFPAGYGLISDVIELVMSNHVSDSIFCILFTGQTASCVLNYPFSNSGSLPTNGLELVEA